MFLTQGYDLFHISLYQSHNIANISDFPETLFLFDQNNKS